MTDTQAAERIWTDGHDYWAHPTHKDDKTEYIRADLVEAMEAENQRLREALSWYGEQARLARLIHSEGDAGRRNLEADGGSRARAALRSTEASHDD